MPIILRFLIFLYFSIIIPKPVNFGDESTRVLLLLNLVIETWPIFNSCFGIIDSSSSSTVEAF